MIERAVHPYAMTSHKSKKRCDPHVRPIPAFSKSILSVFIQALSIVAAATLSDLSTEIPKPIVMQRQRFPDPMSDVLGSNAMTIAMVKKKVICMMTMLERLRDLGSCSVTIAVRDVSVTDNQERS